MSGNLELEPSERVLGMANLVRTSRSGSLERSRHDASAERLAAASEAAEMETRVASLEEEVEELQESSSGPISRKTAILSWHGRLRGSESPITRAQQPAQSTPSFLNEASDTAPFPPLSSVWSA